MTLTGTGKEKRQEALNVVQAGLKELNQALRRGQSEQMRRYLSAMARFHRYSYGNVLLIFSQMPEATHVAGYRAWKELGRSVKKGEKGIGIIAPFAYKQADEDTSETERTIRGFRVVHVFDVSQTEGDELPELATVEGDPGENLRRIER